MNAITRLDLRPPHERPALRDLRSRSIGAAAKRRLLRSAMPYRGERLQRL
jgi:hypothetical protein